MLKQPQQFFEIKKQKRRTLPAKMVSRKAAFAIALFGILGILLLPYNFHLGSISIEKSLNPIKADVAPTEVWWPAAGSTLSGTQPFKAILSGHSLNEYKM